MVIPVDIFGLQACQVGLGCPEMPGHFVKGFAFRIVLPLDDTGVFLKGDAALFLEANNRPLALRHDRPSDPSHIEAEVVESPQKDVGGNRSVFNAVEKFLGMRLDEDLGQQRLDRLVLGKGGPALEVGTCLHFEVGLKGITPRACCYTGVAACQVGPGDLQIEHRLADSRVLVLNDLLGFVGADFAEACPRAVLRVDTVVGSSTGSPADESVTFFHAIGAIAMLNEPIPGLLPSSGRVTTRTR